MSDLEAIREHIQTMLDHVVHVRAEADNQIEELNRLLEQTGPMLEAHAKSVEDLNERDEKVVKWLEDLKAHEAMLQRQAAEIDRQRKELAEEKQHAHEHPAAPEKKPAAQEKKPTAAKRQKDDDEEWSSE